jgi:carbamoyl-phosphate synthase large subunit
VTDSLLIFGGGELQLSIIGVAKEMGFITVVLDPNADSPGKDIGDFFYSVLGDDFEKTLEIAKTHAVKGLVTAATDKPILMMARIATILGLPFPSFYSCDIVLDKAKFKQFLMENDLPHAKGEMFTLETNLSDSSFVFPVISKPVVNSGSRGVIKSNNLEELHLAIKETVIHSTDGRFLIERYIEGDEISVEALVQHGKVYILQLTDKIVSSPPYNVELGHVQPSKYVYLIDKIRSLLQLVVDRTGLNNCALHPELKIKDNEVTIIEIGPRLGGDLITSHLVKLSTGVNMEKQMIRIAVGQEIEMNGLKMASLISFINLPENSRVRRLFAENELKEMYPEVVKFSFDLEYGRKVEKITNSLDRYGYLILKGESVETLLIALNKINSNLISNLITLL